MLFITHAMPKNLLVDVIVRIGERDVKRGERYVGCEQKGSREWGAWVTRVHSGIQGIVRCLTKSTRSGL